jgi:serine-type D-Ala-D-Ala carboxypeptidase (penicillin-binding protein 5/6)
LRNPRPDQIVARQDLRKARSAFAARWTATALLAAALPAFGATKSKKRVPSLKKPAITVIQPEDSENGSRESTKLPSKFRLLQPGELPLSADGAIVIDGYTGRTLYNKNADVRQYPASTTKIMTALLVIEAGSLDQEITIAVEDSKVGESSLSIKPGETYTREQMLYGLMLKSANDVAHALGRDNSGTVESFALKMTQRARELGAMNTSFMNPHGLHHIEHYTTPHDLALITRYAMNQPMFRKIVGTGRHPWVPQSKPEQTWMLLNHNRLLTRFEGCTGVKTGYTNPAQHTLVSAALRSPREVIAVVMHDGKLQKWEDSMLLLSHGLDNPPE